MRDIDLSTNYSDPSTSLLDHLTQLNIAVPRYTSYPPANRWNEMNHAQYLTALTALSQKEPLSIYIHIPFCHSMCLYCGCSVVLNRDPLKEKRYIETLLSEIEIVCSSLPSKMRVHQLHFGGGTPTKVPSMEIKRVLSLLKEKYIFDKNAEISIEIDPRTVSQDSFQKVRDLKNMGFTRVSLGVQDTDRAVQEAVKRRQSVELTRETFFSAREAGFQEINMDLIYGLPLQTRASFRDTIQIIAHEIAPDRISLFSYAKVPWIKKHQKAIPDHQLPQTQEKLLMYVDARQMLLESEYIAIGMDHFAKKSDPLAKQFKSKSIQRNFQGYSISAARSMIGFGMSAISDLPIGYFQNSKELEGYYLAIEKEKRVATDRGFLLSREEEIRRYVIQELMCHFFLDIRKTEELWSFSFSLFFSKSLQKLTWFSTRGYVDMIADGSIIQVTHSGELFIRNIVSCFDLVYQEENQNEHTYSKAI